MAQEYSAHGSPLVAALSWSLLVGWDYYLPLSKPLRQRISLGGIDVETSFGSGLRSWRRARVRTPGVLRLNGFQDRCIRRVKVERVNRLAINPTLLDDNILDLFFAPRA
jgi:hypothetical protein